METPLPAILPGASVDLVFYTQPKTLVELTMEYLLGLQANLLD